MKTPTNAARSTRLASAKSTSLVWADVGGGAQQSNCRRFFLQVETRYLGSRGGRGRTERSVNIIDRQTGKRHEADGLRAAKALCAKLVEVAS